MANLPDDVRRRYGGSRGFRRAKRKALRNLITALRELRLGCAYFPNGGQSVARIDYEVKILERELSEKNWIRSQAV